MAVEYVRRRGSTGYKDDTILTPAVLTAVLYNVNYTNSQCKQNEAYVNKSSISTRALSNDFHQRHQFRGCAAASGFHFTKSSSTSLKPRSSIHLNALDVGDTDVESRSNVCAVALNFDSASRAW